MSSELLQRLEKAVLARNPLLRNKLEPGLPENRIRRILGREKITGEIECLTRLYSWKNGTILNDHPSLDKGFVSGVGEVYHFPELEMAVGHFVCFKEASVSRPRISEAAGYYFPIFWNGSTTWIAVDVRLGNRNPVTVIEFDSKRPVRHAYSSFDELITDCIRANEEDAPLSCFTNKQLSKGSRNRFDQDRL